VKRVEKYRWSRYAKGLIVDNFFVIVRTNRRQFFFIENFPPTADPPLEEILADICLRDFCLIVRKKLNHH